VLDVFVPVSIHMYSYEASIHIFSERTLKVNFFVVIREACG
jgi:hypothetical protein